MATNRTRHEAPMVLLNDSFIIARFYAITCKCLSCHCVDSHLAVCIFCVLHVCVDHEWIYRHCTEVYNEWL